MIIFGVVYKKLSSVSNIFVKIFKTFWILYEKSRHRIHNSKVSHDEPSQTFILLRNKSFMILDTFICYLQIYYHCFPLLACQYFATGDPPSCNLQGINYCQNILACCIDKHLPTSDAYFPTVYRLGTFYSPSWVY